MKTLPKFDDKTRYFMSGKTLNELVAAIRERTPVAGPGLATTETPNGVIFSAGSFADNYPFKVTGTGTDGAIAKGILHDGTDEVVPSIGGFEMGTFNPIDLTEVDGLWVSGTWERQLFSGELVSGGRVVDAEIVTAPVTGSLPTDSTDGVFCIHLWEAGEPNLQYWRTGIRISFCLGTGYMVTPYGSNYVEE